MAEVVGSVHNKQVIQEIRSHRNDNEQQFQSMNAAFQQSERRQEKHIAQLLDVNRQQAERIKELTESMFQLYNSKSTTTNRPMQRGVPSAEQTSAEEQSRKLVTKTFQRLETNIKQINRRDDVTKQLLVERNAEINKLKRQLKDTERQLEMSSIVLNARNSRLEQEQKPGSQQTTDATSDEHLARIKRLKNLPEPLFSASCVASVMFQCGALTAKELDNIRTSRVNRGDIEAAETLLDILERAPPEVFECFLQALRHSKQEHVYKQIIDQEFTADTRHCRIIREHYLYLVDKLDTKHSLLTVHLFVSEVLGQREKEDIEAELTSTRQNEKLLSVLSHKSAEQWGLFLTALDNTGQSHIIEHVTGQMLTETEKSTVRYKNSVGQNVESEITEGITLKQDLEQSLIELAVREEQLQKLHQEFETTTSSLREQIRLKDENDTKHLNIIHTMKRSAAQCENQLNLMRRCLSEIKQTTLRDIDKLKADINIGRQQLEEKVKYLETAIRQREAKPVKHQENELQQKHRKLETMHDDFETEKQAACEKVASNANMETAKLNVQIKQQIEVKDEENVKCNGNIENAVKHANELTAKLEDVQRLMAEEKELSMKATEDLNEVRIQLENTSDELENSKRSLRELQTQLSAQNVEVERLKAEVSMKQTQKKTHELMEKSEPAKIVCRPYGVSPRLQSSLSVLDVCGVTVCDNKLLVVCSFSNSILVFGPNNKQQTNIELEELKEPSDIVSCTETQQVYVTGLSRDFRTRCVWRVSLDGRQVLNWLPKKSRTTSHFEPYTLSVTSRRLLVTSQDDNELLLYGADGVELKRVPLRDTMTSLQHAVETPRGTFIATHCQPLPRVCEVNVDGHVTRVYYDQQQLSDPVYVSFDSDGRIFVADYDKHHVLLLNSKTLELERVLLDTQQHRLTQYPYRLCYTQQTQQLAVGGCGCVQMFTLS